MPNSPIRDLKVALESLLEDAPSTLENLSAANFSFDTPDKSLKPDPRTVNLFLYEVKENQMLRDPVPVTRKVAGTYVRQRPPLRVDCMYLVTAWTSQVPPDKLELEHGLLGEALLWLSRFPRVPDEYLIGSPTLLGQTYPPLITIGQVDGIKDSGEFWAALGVSPRPSFNLVVTIPMDLVIPEPDGPPVVTKDIRIRAKMPPGEPEPLLAEVFAIGGTVRESGTGLPVADATVTIVETGNTATTDADGQFRLDNLAAGQFTTRVVADGFVPNERAIEVPGVSLDAFDVEISR